jgi:Mn-dependent DtxR family transcriptional regulator
MEDYLEKIYELIKGKGYARVSDIAAELSLQPSSVTKMVQKMAEVGYIHYERYRGLVLTELGASVGEAMKDRHAMLDELLSLLGVDEADRRVDVEGIEHHLSPTTVEAFQDLTAFLRENSEAFQTYRATRPKE